jgi:hypothetical protein
LTNRLSRRRPRSSAQSVAEDVLLKAASTADRDRWLESFRALINRERQAVVRERGYVDAGV